MSRQQFYNLTAWYPSGYSKICITEYQGPGLQPFLKLKDNPCVKVENLQQKKIK